jgi:hypothetical protein
MNHPRPKVGLGSRSKVQRAAYLTRAQPPDRLAMPLRSRRKHVRINRFANRWVAVGSRAGTPRTETACRPPIRKRANESSPDGAPSAHSGNSPDCCPADSPIFAACRPTIDASPRHRSLGVPHLTRHRWKPWHHKPARGPPVRHQDFSSRSGHPHTAPIRRFFQSPLGSSLRFASAPLGRPTASHSRFRSAPATIPIPVACASLTQATWPAGLSAVADH